MLLFALLYRLGWSSRKSASLQQPLPWQKGPALRRRFAPRLEALESRTLLSTFTVDHLADDLVGSDTSGSLRYCLSNAGDRDTISFGVTGTINLTSALPTLAHSIEIDGPGADLMTMRRNTGGMYRIFTVNSGADVSISGVAIANGGSASLGFAGGGIYNAGTLTLVDSNLSGNIVSFEGQGGGIYNAGTLTVSNTTLASNGVDVP
jgi:hypothetical protein